MISLAPPFILGLSHVRIGNSVINDSLEVGELLIDAYRSLLAQSQLKLSMLTSRAGVLWVSAVDGMSLDLLR
jgi:hypothetical protein